jgi:hypothetical protein
MRNQLDYLDLQTLRFIGGDLAEQEPRFKIYAKLGFEKARQYAAVECINHLMNWEKENKDPDISALLKLTKLFLEELGIAELMPSLKELTRITMIQGNKTEWTKYSDV